MYTDEQQRRLGVDEHGNPAAAAAVVAASSQQQQQHQRHVGRPNQYVDHAGSAGQGVDSEDEFGHGHGGSRNVADAAAQPVTPTKASSSSSSLFTDPTNPDNFMSGDYQSTGTTPEGPQARRKRNASSKKVDTGCKCVIS